jgi:hypothetical protein
MAEIRNDIDEVFDRQGNVVASTSVARDVTHELNYALLYEKARAALVSNSAFLAITTPTAAQNAAQAKALTRQVNGIIKLLLSELGDVSDT